jgi:hypothetical protein
MQRTSKDVSEEDENLFGDNLKKRAEELKESRLVNTVMPRMSIKVVVVTSILRVGAEGTITALIRAPRI